MNDAGEIEWPLLDQLVDWHVASGTGAIVAVGTTGESATLDVSEHCKVVEAVVRHSAGRIPVIAGTGSNNTREAIELTREARAVGADACLLVTPYYNKPSQEGLYRHFMSVADAVEVPQILYNVPGRTSVDMSNETTLRLASHPNIVGTKDATGQLDRGRALIAAAPEGFAIYSGDDPTAIELIGMGARGNISVTANLMPACMAEACSKAGAGDMDRARALNARMMDLHRVLFLEANPIPVKWALHLMGRIGPGIRLPLTPLAQKYRAELSATMRAVGLLTGN
jgi:4-hydroxy-tetrahydrodipicolinate synthase